ncbi:hypothetical protein LWI28_001179 [Acer negundo]|uniref:Uncharacterized protein n=1 Tax=Acer negundo TaxID=4023 RepID=A0AAD5IBG9_ACENE|nr:hypothetical protein LWI28_001179 [Acer negundo]
MTWNEVTDFTASLPIKVVAYGPYRQFRRLFSKRSRLARDDDEEVSGQKKRKENTAHREGDFVDLRLGKEDNHVRFSAKWEGILERVPKLGVSGAADTKITSAGRSLSARRS